MKKKYRVLVLVVFALICLSLAFAQSGEAEENLTVEQLQELIRIQRQEIRQAAKTFLVDELPVLAKIDPARASKELDSFMTMLATMSDSEVMYLLGHMYAREGADDRAITMFDSVLRTELNEDARQMLNLVLYRKLITLLEQDNRTAAKDFLRAIVFENYNSSPYFPAYLYLFSDLSADSGNYAEVISLVQAYNENRDIVLNLLLPAKQQVLSLVNALDIGAYYRDPSQQNFTAINAEIDQILRDVTALNNQIISLQGMVFVNELQSIHEYETKNLTQLKQLLLDYANSPVRTEQILTPAIGHIKAVKASIAFYDGVLRAFDNMLQSRYQSLQESGNEADLQRYTADLYLDKLIQTDRTIAIYSDIIAETNQTLSANTNLQQAPELIALRDDTVQKKADLEVRRQQYLGQIEYPSELERQIFTEILTEYNALLADKQQLELTANELEDYVYTEVRTIINEDMRSEIRPQVASIISSVSDARVRHQVFTSGFGESLKNLEFITLQMSYRELMSHYNIFARNQASLPDEERMLMQSEFRSQQLGLIAEINSFLAENPNFAAIDQPGGGNLAQAADLYYNLGELQFYALPQDLSPALLSYRRALQLDAKLPDRDLALYNIAFISSELKRLELDSNRIAYREAASINSTPPANAVYNESNFSETLAALNEIVRDYPDSRVYEESIYRLGLLYFRFAEDSISPVEYRNTAVGYFDQIIARTDSPLYYEALYQRGWVRLNSFETEDLRMAMNDFMEILRAADAGRISNPDLARDYRVDAVNNIAYCLIAFDGTDFRTQSRGIVEIERIFADYQNQEVVNSVIDQATQNKYNMRSMLQATDFLRYRIDQSPLALHNPSLLDSMQVLYANSTAEMREGENLPQIRRRLYQEMVDSYNLKSKWYAQNKDKDIAGQLKIVNKAYDNLGVIMYNDFVVRKNREALQSYIAHMNDYDSFVKAKGENYAKFRADTDSIFVDFYALLAETTEQPEDFQEAIRQLYSYNDKYPNNNSYFYNEQRSIFYAQKVYEISTEAIKDTDSAPIAGQSATMEEAFAMLRTAAMRFVDTSKQERFATPENLNRAALLIVSLAEIQGDLQHSDEAIALFNAALEFEQNLSDADKREIYLRLAILHSDADRYAESESWFRKALPLTTSNQERQDIQNDILVQIQNSFEAAADSGDYNKEATERLRFAAEHNATTQSAEVLGQKYAAVQAYINAKAYQQAIDLLIELSANERDVVAVYTWYMEAAKIASDKEQLNDPALALRLEQDFIRKHPASNYAFALRMVHIKAAFDDPARATEAAEGYLQLFEDVNSKVTDAGNVAPSSILSDAILAYSKTNNISKEYELRNRFIALYPKHENVIPHLEYMAQGHFDRGEMEDYNRLAKDIFRRDSSRNSLYQFVAEKELARIGTRFSEAYDNKDFTAALSIRKEYQQMESAYKKEGLIFQNEKAHEFFAAVQKEYDDLQKHQAFLKSYDSKIAALNSSNLFTKAPDTHIKVNPATTWDKNLGAGDKRLAGFQKYVQGEVAKVMTLVRQGNESGYYIDNDRRIAAIDLIARMNERAIEVANTQIEKYFRTTYEAQFYRDEYPGDQLNALIANVASQQTQQYANDLVSWQFNMFRLYHLPGYRNAKTEAVVASLTEKSIPLEYRSDEHILNSDWQQELVPEGSDLKIKKENSPSGTSLGKLSLPAQKTLRLSKTITTTLAPDFAYLHLMYPMEVQIKLNGSLVEAEWVPIDTLSAGKAATTHYAVVLPGESFAAGANQIELEFTNNRESNQDLALNLQIKTSELRIQQNIPPVITTVHSNKTWRVITIDAETEKESTSYATAAAKWDISWENIEGFEPSPATPIWVNEDDAPIETVILETDFNLNAEFREGHIDFVAPENVTVYLNGNRISSAMMDFDPDPLMVYAIPMPIPAEFVQMGKNTLRFEITNSSGYRGFLATITYAQAGKEKIR